MAESYKYPDYKRFKFRELKIYGSTEWLADNKKKYRQVFDRQESTYIYAELSFFNKLFDEEDWDIEVELRCYSVKKATKKELCVLPFKRKVSKYDSIVYIREGWGNKKDGAFWTKGAYYWEAWVEGEKVATKYFYIEDSGGAWETGQNPFLEVQSLKLFEGPYDDVNEDDRRYFKQFSGAETRYIYVEITLRNLNFSSNWQCELFTKFYNNARELKGQVVRLHRVDKTDDLIRLTAGWGSNAEGSWRKDNYTAELIFMDRLLAVIPFEVSESHEEGISGVLLPNKNATVMLADEEGDPSFEELMERLDGLIGLRDIKIKVREHAKYIQFLQLRKDKGFEEKEEINVHSVFIGNPGTGKTTVAKMMGKLYKKMGLLTKGHVTEVDRVDLVGEYIGQTAPKVKAVIEKARGGVLFIDEAYSLARSNDDSKDFGREVVEILLKEMSNGLGDLAVIVAGYPKEMKHFMDSNPGLKSRFKLYFEFTDYLPQELSKIADYACTDKGVVLLPDARMQLDEMITEAFRNRDKTFGNARFVFDLIEKAKINLGLRVMDSKNPKELENEILETIEFEDVNRIEIERPKELPSIPVDHAFLKKALGELDELIGMDSIKKQIHELVELVRFYQETGRNTLNNFYLHTVFIGNPGTGKTTVARILTKIYKALGMLERGHIIETDRQGLVAGFVGQTAIKTAEKIEEAKGGVLFIDEAYALTTSTNGGTAHSDFGNEAIQTLLKRMEDQRGEFFVFVAGYPDNMEEFLKANPGLNSRFDKILKFDDYEPAQLMEIAMFMFGEKGFKLRKAAREHLSSYLAFLHEYRDKYFGNARSVRNVVTEVIKNQNLRLAALPVAKRTKAALNTIILEDVKTFKLDKDDFIFNKKTIGFKRSKT